MRLDDGRRITANLVDYSSLGVSISLDVPLSVGDVVVIRGKGQDKETGQRKEHRGRVAWCLEKEDGNFRAGLQLDAASNRSGGWEASEPITKPEQTEEDLYEILQASPNAHPDTLHRIYRALAQRFHPDNAETGDEETFKKVQNAYRTLQDPAKRAAYDVRRRVDQKHRWRIFESPSAAVGIEAEKRKRSGILLLLYSKRMNEPDHPALSLIDLEELLECPRDPLRMSLWYLKEKGCLYRNDRGRFSISASGVDEAEESQAATLRARKQIATSEHESAAVAS